MPILTSAPAASRRLRHRLQELVDQALGLDQLEREGHRRVAEGARVLAHEDLARLEHLAHQRALEIREVQRAAGVAALGARPFAPGLLERVVDALAQLAARRHHLRLQADARADDVVLHDHLGALGVGGVAHQRAAAVAQAAGSRRARNRPRWSRSPSRR
jgi:hypothetical protein